jgi:ribonuclease HII
VAASRQDHGGAGSAGLRPTLSKWIPDVSEELAAYAAGSSAVAGVDEVGRGAWAGPLVAAAVVLPDPRDGLADALRGVNDSKLLAPTRREAFYTVIVSIAISVGVGYVAAPELDLLGLTAAGELAMVRAVRGLAVEPDLLLVDGVRIRSYPSRQKAIVHGDGRCLSIAAASIVAKVVRDRWLCDLDARYAGYGLSSNKGYGAISHRRALERAGSAPIHRRSYAPIAGIGGRSEG